MLPIIDNLVTRIRKGISVDDPEISSLPGYMQAFLFFDYDQRETKPAETKAEIAREVDTKTRTY